MDLKLNNNQHLTISTFPDSVKAKITTVYIKNCPQINALSLLNSIMSLQESVTPKLSRIRVDIGACSGSYSDLMKFSNLQGFDDDYNFQAKPRFVGSYYIDSWHTIEQLNNARSIFESADFTISHDSTKLINFDDVAVQTLDSTKPNYNPAVAIILQNKNLGVTLDTPVVPGQTGRWFMTKDDAAAITAMWTYASNQYQGFWFQAKETVTDSNKLVTDEVIDYDFEGFDELKYFTQITLDKVDGVLHGFFYNCKKLKYVTIPDNATVLYGTFWGCSKLERVTGVDHLTSIGTCAFYGCGNLILTQSDINPNIQGIGPQAFCDCSKITINTIPAAITCIAENANRQGTFRNTTSIPYIHFLSETPITGLLRYARNHLYNAFYGTTYNIYVGNGQYKQRDTDILIAYKNTGVWSLMTSYLKSWYDFVVPTFSYDHGVVTMITERDSIIYYTTNGATPTKESTQYTEPFAWDGQGVIKVLAISASGNEDPITKDFYAQTVLNPTIVIDTTNNQVVLSCATSGAIIYYTTDGSCPTLDSPVYSGAITPPEDIVKIRCFATAQGHNDSEVVAKICVMDDTLWGTDGDSSYFAIQCIDSSKPNYNPAVCIILDNNNKLTDKCYCGGGYLTKTELALKSFTTEFANKTTITDSNCLIDGGNYDFEYFHEFKYWPSFPYTNSGNAEGFYMCSKLKEITIPTTITSIPIDGWGHGGFAGCSSLKTINITHLVGIIQNHVFYGCSNLELTDFPVGVTGLSSGAFRGCFKLAFTNLGNCVNIGYTTGNYDGVFSGCANLGNTLREIPETVTHIGDSAFRDITNFPYLHILAQTPPTLQITIGIFSGSYKLYVGDGSSAAHDDAILADYLAANVGWSSYSSRLDTWYNYLHPTT